MPHPQRMRQTIRNKQSRLPILLRLKVPVLRNQVVPRRGHRRQSVCFTPGRGGFRFGMVNNFAKTRRSREGRRGFIVGDGGGGTRINAIGTPTVAKLTKPGHPLHVEVEPVVPFP